MVDISLRDYTRFGRLYMNNGNFEGEQIVPHLKAPNDEKPMLYQIRI